MGRLLDGAGGLTKSRKANVEGKPRSSRGGKGELSGKGKKNHVRKRKNDNDPWSKSPLRR